MAGFVTGLVHGVLLCGATLAALSLAIPRETAQDRPVEETHVPEAVAPADAGANELPETGITAGGLDSLPPPVGSDFTRGADMQPATPGPLEMSSSRPSSDAPVAAAPTAEPAPSLATLSASRPDDPTSPTVPDAPQSVAAAPDLPRVPTAEAPIPVAPPGKVQTPGLDRRPELGAPSPDGEQTQGAPAAQADEGGGDDNPVAAAPPADTPAEVLDAGPARAHGPIPADGPSTTDDALAVDAPAAATAETPAPQAPPAMPAPALDLSTPPDLRDLRMLERN